MEIKIILKFVVCLHAAMGHDSCGIMRIICIICKQVWTWTENHGERSEFRSLPMGSFLSWRKNSRISWHWTDVLNWACAFVCICACARGLWEQTCKYCPVCLVQVVYIDINQCCYVVCKKNIFALILSSSYLLFQTQMNPHDIASKHAGTVSIFKCLYCTSISGFRMVKYRLLLTLGHDPLTL